jgi:hypothetical protein
MVNIINRPLGITEITRAEVCEIVEDHYQSALFRQQLEKAAYSGDLLLRVMGRFFQFSSAFGPGQASLASHIAARKDLFNTSNEVGIFADRSVEVGAGIFFDSFFCTSRSDIMAFLDSVEVEVDGIPVPANIWFRRHIIAEAEHFDAGIEAANQALHYYTGPDNLQTVKQWIFEGVKAVAVLQHNTVGAFLDS